MLTAQVHVAGFFHLLSKATQYLGLILYSSSWTSFPGFCLVVGENSYKLETIVTILQCMSISVMGMVISSTGTMLVHTHGIMCTLKKCNILKPAAVEHHSISKFLQDEEFIILYNQGCYV